eukprot:10651309-Prorocentrum_lima.AAC.1
MGQHDPPGSAVEIREDGMSPRSSFEIVHQLQQVLSGHERFRHQAEQAVMTSRQGEQNALRH